MTRPADQRSPPRLSRRRLLRRLAAGALTIALLGTIAAAGGSSVAAGRAWVIDPLPSLPVPVPSAPVPSIPIPSVPVPSVPLPSVSLGPLPSLLPTARPTASSAATALPVGATPRATPTTPSAAQASAVATPSDVEAAESPTPTPSATPGGDSGVGGPPNTDPPEVQSAPAAEDGEELAIGDFVVPALALGVSGLMVLLVVLAQLGAGAAILPAVRRTLGNLGVGRLGGRIKPTGDEPLPPA